MKKLFVSKNIITKIALILIIMILFQTIVPKPVNAAGIGGTLLSPIVSLVVALADGVIDLLQDILLTQQDAFIEVDLTGAKSTWGEIAFFVISGIVCFAAVAIFLGATLGIAAITALAGKVGVGLLVKIGVGVSAGATGAYWLFIYPKIAPVINQVCFGNSFTYTNIALTPETILSNQIPLFNVNFFQDIVMPENLDEKGKAIYDLAITIRGLVKDVYTSFASVILVAMVAVLLYVGIRALTSLKPREKSKYKQSFANCGIAIIIIVMLHFIMSMGTSIVTMITQSIVTKNYECQNTEEEINSKMEDADDDGRIDDKDFEKQYTAGETIAVQGDEIYSAFVDRGWIPFTNADDEIESQYPKAQIGDADTKTINIVATNFLESARYKAQKIYDSNPNDSEEIKGNWDHIGWSFVYIMLVILTVSFVYMYGKRFLYMAALTMFAPIVGLMYPINKVDGSRAQTLNLWVREYMGNLVMQPFHLFLYTILINGAMAAAVNNPIYVIIALMGMVFIERLIKDLIGIQDTRIGGLGNALNDTNRAIKNATNAAKEMGRKATRVAKGAARVGAGIVEKKWGEDGETNEEANTPRMQPPPAAPAAAADEENIQRRPDPNDPDSMQISRDPMDVHEQESLAFNSFEENQPESIYSDEDFIEQLRAQDYTDEEIQEQLDALAEVRAEEKRLEEEAEAKRLAEELTPEEEADLLRDQLRSQGYSDQEIEEQIRDQMGEVPIIGANESELRAEQGTQLDEEMEPAELAEAMRRTGMSEKELLHGKTIGRVYNPSLVIGENDAVGTNLNAQIPSFLDPETASRVAQEKMAEIEERGGQRYTSKSGIEAVRTGEDGNTIVADFATLHSKGRKIEPVDAIAKEIPQELAVGQDFMPDLNKRNNSDPNLKINEPIARRAATSLNVTSMNGGVSGDKYIEGSVARVQATGPNTDKLEGVTEQRRVIKFNPSQIKTGPEVASEVTHENMVKLDQNGEQRFTAGNPDTIKETIKSATKVSAGVAVDKAREEAATTRFTGPDGVEYQVDIDREAITAARQRVEQRQLAKSTETPARTNFEVDNAKYTNTGVDDITYSTELRGATAKDNITSSGMNARNNYTSDISGKFKNPGAVEVVERHPADEAFARESSARVNKQADHSEVGSATGRKEPIKFTPPEAKASAPEIPEDRRRVITYDPISSNRSGGIENKHVETPEESSVTRVRSSSEENKTIVSNEHGSQTRVNPTSSNRRGGTEIHTPIEPVENPGQSTVSSARNSNGGNQPSVRDSSRADATVPEPTQAGPRRKKLSPEVVEEIVEITGAVTGKVATRAGGGVLNVIETAANAMAGQTGAVVEQGRSIVEGASSDIADIADAGGRAREFKGQGQMSNDAHHIQRELNIEAKEARMIDAYCDANKIQDKHNKTVVAEMYRKSDKKDMPTFIALSAQVIKAKKESLKEDDVKAYLNGQGISSKTREALIGVFKKSRK